MGIISHTIKRIPSLNNQDFNGKYPAGFEARGSPDILKVLSFSYPELMGSLKEIDETKFLQG